MSSFKIILAFCLIIAFAAAAPIGEFGGGIFGDIEKTLNDEQKQQLKAIFTNDALTKQQIQEQIKEYFEKIGGDALVSAQKYLLGSEFCKIHRTEIKIFFHPISKFRFCRTVIAISQRQYLLIPL